MAAFAYKDVVKVLILFVAGISQTYGWILSFDGSNVALCYSLAITVAAGVTAAYLGILLENQSAKIRVALLRGLSSAAAVAYVALIVAGKLYARRDLGFGLGIALFEWLLVLFPVFIVGKVWADKVERRQHSEDS